MKWTGFQRLVRSSLAARSARRASVGSVGSKSICAVTRARDPSPALSADAASPNTAICSGTPWCTAERSRTSAVSAGNASHSAPVLNHTRGHTPAHGIITSAEEALQNTEEQINPLKGQCTLKCICWASQIQVTVSSEEHKLRFFRCSLSVM